MMRIELREAKETDLESSFQFSVVRAGLVPPLQAEVLEWVPVAGVVTGTVWLD